MKFCHRSNSIVKLKQLIFNLQNRGLVRHSMPGKAILQTLTFGWLVHHSFSHACSVSTTLAKRSKKGRLHRPEPLSTRMRPCTHNKPPLHRPIQPPGQLFGRIQLAPDSRREVCFDRARRKAQKSQPGTVLLLESPSFTTDNPDPSLQEVQVLVIIASVGR